MPECVKNSLFQLACKRLVPRAGLSKAAARVGKMNMCVYKAPLLLQTIVGNLGYQCRERGFIMKVLQWGATPTATIVCFVVKTHYVWPAMCVLEIFSEL